MNLLNIFKKNRHITTESIPMNNATIAPKDYSDREHFKEGYKDNVIVYSCVRNIALEVGKIPLILKKGGELIETHPQRVTILLNH